MPKVFISRELAGDSPFLRRLTAAGYAVTARALLSLSAVPFDEAPPADWVFFYSKRAVQFFFTGLPHPLPATTRLAAIGEGTAAALRRRGLAVAFTGTGDPATTADAFRRLAGGQRVLFPRARHSRRSVQELLAGDVVALDLVVYDNRPAPEAAPGDAFDVLVFTSPLNARAYFARHAPRAGQRVVAIGAATAEALRNLGVARIEIAAEPSEEALADAVLRPGGPA